MKGNPISNRSKSIIIEHKEKNITVKDDNFLQKKRKNTKELTHIDKDGNHLSHFSTEEIYEQGLVKGSFCIASEENTKKGIIQSTKAGLDWKRDTITNLSHKNERACSLRRNYLMNLKELDQEKRRILLDWLMEVSQIFNFQRETYHSAVVILDIYLSKINNVIIKEFQLIGITCLLISAKNEEIIIPSIANFAQTTNYAYISSEILSLEKNILKCLNWRIHYPNMAFWLNYLITKWDSFTEEETAMPKFNKYQLMSRTAFWVIDSISLDYNHLLKDMQIISCVVMYIVIGLEMECFNIEDVRELFAVNENNIENYQEYNMFFNSFLMKELSIELISFGEHLSYVSLFFCYYNPAEETSNEYNNNNNYLQLMRTQEYSESKSLAVQIIEEKRSHA